MNAQNLPQDFEGFSTAELIKLWGSIPNRKFGVSPKEPREKVLTMHRLLDKYRLAPIYWGDGEQRKADMIQSRKLLKPFGIDPAPWADEEGNELPEEVRAARHRKLELEEAGRKAPDASS
jgi:hypothetical protein